MRWMLIGLGVVAGLLILITAIGAVLPQRHVTARSARYSAPPESIWHTLTDPASAAEWRPDVDNIEVLSESEGAPRRWRERYSRGDALTLEVVRSEAPRLLETRIADEGLPFGGSWTFELQPDGGGTRLTITERGEVYNPFFRFVSRFIIGHAKTADTYLRALGERLGEEVSPVGAGANGETQ